jgi:hypothetical protein
MPDDELSEAFVDATEQPIHRPKRKQERYYSGKKKRHTAKHQVVVVRKKKPGPGGPRKRKTRIAAVSGASPGPVHDTAVYDRSRLVIPPDVPVTGDTGYLGTRMETPTRKPRGRPLTRRQKAGNRRLARQRVVVEHGIGKMTIWRIAADRYRNPLSRHTLMMKNVGRAPQPDVRVAAPDRSPGTHAPTRCYCATSLLAGPGTGDLHVAGAELARYWEHVGFNEPLGVGEFVARLRSKDDELFQVEVPAVRLLDPPQQQGRGADAHP